jgi:hypothetical protein
MHLDLAANSKDESPNPRIRDLKIRFTYGTGPDKGSKTGWEKVYGPRYAKILARYQPMRRDVSVGYFIQRSDDNLTLFALARYVQEKFGYYPYIPMTWDQIDGMPRVPATPDGSGESADDSSIIAFETKGEDPVWFKQSGVCPSTNKITGGEDLEIGAPFPKTAYPDSYWQQYDKWVAEVKSSLAEGDQSSEESCFNADADVDFAKIAPPLGDSAKMLDEVVERACSTLPGYATDEPRKEWSSCLQKDADRFGGEMAVIFTLKRNGNGDKPQSIDCENSLKYMFHKRECHKGGFQTWPTKEDQRFTYRMLNRGGKCPEGIDVFHRSSGSRPF